MSLPDKSDKILNYKGLLDDKVTKTSAIEDNVTDYGGPLLADKNKNSVPVNNIKIREIYFHIYIPITVSNNYTIEDYFNYIYELKNKNGKNLWDSLGITLYLKTNLSTAIDDLKVSLNKKETVVIYMGHSRIEAKKKKTHGILPGGIDSKLIENKELCKWINNSLSSVFLIAGCSTNNCFGKNDIKNKDISVITTESNPDTYTTDSLEWAHAIKAFLLTLTNNTNNTLNDAIKAANKSFVIDGCAKDKFVLTSGNPALKII